MFHLTRLAALSLAVATPAAAIARTAHPPAPAPPGAHTLALRPARGTKLPAVSAPLRMDGRPYHLVALSAPAFARWADGKLTATAEALVTTADEAQYEIHIALFDRLGRLLATARTRCDVPRIWLGRAVSMPRDLRFDFGASQDYVHAASYAIAISRVHIPPPG